MKKKIIKYTQCHRFFFSYNENTEACDLAFLDFLEDPDVGDIALDIYIDLNTIENINMYCRGGYRCCHRGNLNLCGEGDGDCDHDDDCTTSGSQVNCMVNIFSFSAGLKPELLRKIT